MFILLNQIWKTKDIASAMLLLFVGCVALWIMALPLNRTVQESYLRRFHLASANFAVWAIQQPVPAMYNFENRIWASRTAATAEELDHALCAIPNTRPSVASNDLATNVETDPVNHFPTRAFTFGRTRSFLKQNPSWYYYLRSRYRDLEIRSAFKISPVSESEVLVNRLEVTID